MEEVSCGGIEFYRSARRCTVLDWSLSIFRDIKSEVSELGNVVLMARFFGR
jgi:hypothetical protein